VPLLSNINSLLSIKSPPSSAPALWTPSAISTLAWFDANDSGTITIATGVSQWNDKSGNGRHISQGTATNQPAYTANTLNSRHCVVFDGSNDSLQRLSLNLPNTSLFIVFNRSSRLQPVFEVQSPDNRALVAPGSGDGVTPQYIQYNNYYLNGTSTASNFCSSSGAAALVSATGMNNFAIDRFNAGSAVPGFQFLNGYIAEVVLISDTLFAANKDIVEGYLAHKWGLTANLPGGHPYKTNPPTL
jgi:hypothetical protein